MRKLLILLLCLISLSGSAQLLANHGLMKVTAPVGPSPSSLTSSHIFNASQDMWVYKPPGYDDNADNYPLIIFYGGDGTRGTNINLYKSSGEGVIDYLNQGDEPPGVLICAPQIPSGDYAISTEFTAVMTYMTANYRVNTNRVYATGLSRGGFMTRLLMINSYASVAAFLQFSGTISSIPWTSLTDRGVWLHHGTTDGTVGYALNTALAAANITTIDMNIGMLASTYFSVGHSSVVWNDNGYNRKERTDATGTADYDYVRWLKKFSIDQLERATLHTEYAEHSVTIEDYRLALIQVNLLSSGADKTALLARLSTLKSTIDNGGKRYLVDQGTSTQTTSGNWNNQTTHTAGASISNLIDDAGGSSTIGWTIVNQFASSAREGNLTSDRMRGQYFGLDRQAYRDGMNLMNTISNGRAKYTGLNNAKTYNCRFYVARSDNTLTDNPEISITIGGTTKTLYCEFNTTHYIEFLNISPSSGEIIIDATGSGDTNVYIVATELILNP